MNPSHKIIDRGQLSWHVNVTVETRALETRETETKNPVQEEELPGQTILQNKGMATNT